MDKKEEQQEKKSPEGNKSRGTVLLTTDGTNVEIKYDDVSLLEVEMMLTKALQYLRIKKV